MGENSFLKKNPELSIEKQEARENALEKLRYYLEAHEILENDWLIKQENYDDLSPEELEKKQNNKLRTTWFTGSLQWIGIFNKKFKLDNAKQSQLFKMLKELLAEENQLVFQLMRERDEFEAYDPEVHGPDVDKYAMNLQNKTKKIQREIAPRFLARKKELIHAVDGLLKETIEKLK